VPDRAGRVAGGPYGDVVKCVRVRACACVKTGVCLGCAGSAADGQPRPCTRPCMQEGPGWRWVAGGWQPMTAQQKKQSKEAAACVYVCVCL